MPPCRLSDRPSTKFCLNLHNDHTVRAARGLPAVVGVSRRNLLLGWLSGVVVAGTGSCARGPVPRTPGEGETAGRSTEGEIDGPSREGVTVSPSMGRRFWGAYVEDPGREGSLYELASLQRLEGQLGRRFPIVSGFTTQFIPSSFLKNMIALAREGRSSLISYDVQWRLSDIVAGEHDADLRATAGALQAVGGPIYLRPFAEMNGDWSPWSIENDSRTVSSHSEWIAAWRRVVSIFRDASAANVRFIWCVNSLDEPRSNRLESYWPGAEWVDLLGIDAYNWGNPWLSHREMIDEVYARVTALAPSHKVWLCEFGCKEPNVADGAGPLGDRSKAQWIADLMSDASYPQLEALVLFSVKKERDWRVDSTQESREAFRAGWVS